MDQKGVSEKYKTGQANKGKMTNVPSPKTHNEENIRLKFFSN
jgi:hypothetical protein